jgi:hypothetical protein
MPRRPDQTKDALNKDIDRLDLMIGRAEGNTRRDPAINREIINKLTWVKLKLREESIVTKKAS